MSFWLFFQNISIKWPYYDIGHSKFDGRVRLFQRAMVTAETDKLRIARFCVQLHGFLTFKMFSAFCLSDVSTSEPRENCQWHLQSAADCRHSRFYAQLSSRRTSFSSQRQTCPVSPRYVTSQMDRFLRNLAYTTHVKKDLCADFETDRGWRPLDIDLYIHQMNIVNSCNGCVVMTAR